MWVPRVRHSAISRVTHKVPPADQVSDHPDSVVGSFNELVITFPNRCVARKQPCELCEAKEVQ